MSRAYVSLLVLALIAGEAMAAASVTATSVATYGFNDSFNADEAGVPAIVPTLSLSTSAFVPDVVFGQPRQVWSFDGNAVPANQQSGLTLDTTDLVVPNDYSIELVFLFSQRQDDWRRIIDVQNRQSDNGFYVDPLNNLSIYPVSSSTQTWTNNVYHHVVLTNDGSTVNTYLDGGRGFATTTSMMNLNNVNNPGYLMHFFLDNVAGGGSGEFSDGRVALVRLWSGVLTPEEVRRLAQNPFVPEPRAAMIVLPAIVAAALRRRHTQWFERSEPRSDRWILISNDGRKRDTHR
jgi:hypothetical protein